MTVRQPRYSKEEFARRGDEIDEPQVRQRVEKAITGRAWQFASATLRERLSRNVDLWLVSLVMMSVHT